MEHNLMLYGHGAFIKVKDKAMLFMFSQQYDHPAWRP